MPGIVARRPWPGNHRNCSRSARIRRQPVSNDDFEPAAFSKRGMAMDRVEVMTARTGILRRKNLLMGGRRTAAGIWPIIIRV